MSNDYITVNGGEHVHLSLIKRVRMITDEERQSLEKLNPNIDASRFNTRIDEAGNGKFYATETLDDMANQGVDLIQIKRNSFIPRANIQKVRNLTDEDRKEFKENRGRDLRDDFKSRIETRAGNVLATMDAADVMRTMDHPYQPMFRKNEAPKQDMAAERDAVMSQATKQPRGKSPEFERERHPG